METYQNLNGDSGVHSYAITANSITVKFKDEAIYLYSYASPGINAVEIMKKLAVQGAGLNSYINTNVRKAYERKIA